MQKPVHLYLRATTLTRRFEAIPAKARDILDQLVHLDTCPTHLVPILPLVRPQIQPPRPPALDFTWALELELDSYIRHAHDYLAYNYWLNGGIITAAYPVAHHSPPSVSQRRTQPLLTRLLPAKSHHAPPSAPEHPSGLDS